MDELIKQHDKLLENMPEGGSHDSETCPLCNPTEPTPETDERGEMEKYTQSELDAAVAAAVAPLQAELSSLKDAEVQGAIDAQVTAVREEAAAEIADLQAQLDAEMLRAEAAEQAQADLIAFLEEAQAEAEREAALAQVKAERAEILRGLGFPEERIEARIEDYAGMDEATFQARIEDLQALAASKPQVDEAGEAPAEVAMRNVRNETASANVNFVARMSSLFNAAEENKVNLSSLAGHQ